MALSLKIRKNIRDATAKKDAALQRIEEAVGVKFEFEVDFAAVLAAKADMSESQKDQIGDLIYGGYLEEFSLGLSELATQRQLFKEAVVELATARKITFSIITDLKTWKNTARKNSSSYCRASIVDSVIVIEVNRDNWCCNIHEIRSGLNDTFAGAGISLTCRQDIADHTERISGLLSEVFAASGVLFELEVDYAGLMESITSRDYDDRLGQFVWTYIEAVGRNIIQNCKSDSLNKEAVDELCYTRKIKFQVYQDKKSYDKIQAGTSPYGRGRVYAGDLVIELNNENLYCNVDQFFDFNKTFAGA